MEEVVCLCVKMVCCVPLSPSGSVGLLEVSHNCSILAAAAAVASACSTIKIHLLPQHTPVADCPAAGNAVLFLADGNGDFTKVTSLQYCNGAVGYSRHLAGSIVQAAG
jgi:hypothetical protein